MFYIFSAVIQNASEQNAPDLSQAPKAKPADSSASVQKAHYRIYTDANYEHNWTPGSNLVLEIESLGHVQVYGCLLYVKGTN